MECRRLGNSDLDVSRLGLGTWAIGGPWQWGWGSQDDAESVGTIHRALELGINWIDTAPVYGLGHAERMIGKALREVSERPLVFTKCGLVWDDAGRVRHILKRDSIEREVDASLRRLGVDVLDLCQIHWPNPEEDVEEAWEALAELRERGKVRYAGVSNFSIDQLDRARAIAEVTSLQPPYSMIHRDVAGEVLPYCLEHGLGVVNYAPMASGLLTGTMSRERIRELPDDDWRKKNIEFKEPRVTRNLAVAAAAGEVAAGLGCTPAEVAVAWTLKHPAVTAAIVGARRPAQLEGVIRAPEIRWGEDAGRRLAAAVEEHGRS